MFQISPMARYGVTAYRANVIVDAKLRTRQALKKYAKFPRGYVEAAWLRPHTFCVRHPQTFVVDVDVGDKVAAVAMLRFEGHHPRC